MSRRSWLVKSDPDEYGWPELVAAGEDCWDGVRNYQARNFLREMGAGDAVLFYHSGKARAVVGLARVTRAAYPDPTTEDERWVAVDLAAGEPLAAPVTLKAIKADPALGEMLLVRQSRLSVMPVTPAEFARVLELGRGA